MLVFLTMLSYIMKIIEVIVILAMVLIGMDLFVSLWREPHILRGRAAAKSKASVREMLRKEQLRREKEASAYEGFFEESFVAGFDPVGALRYRGAKVLTKEAREYYRQMNDLYDAPIFKNTKDL